MCFSAEADLVAGAAVGLVAVDALRHVRRPAQLPLAALPAVFSVHQLTEVAVWWAHEGRVSRDTGETATVVYLVVAFLLPVLVPVAVCLLEPAGVRRRLLTGLVPVGVAVAGALLVSTADGPVCSRVDGHHIVYDIGLERDVVVMLAYVAATCGAMLLSSYRPIRVYGVVNLVVVAALGAIQQNAVVSLWCVWAAVTSVLIAVHLRSDAAGPRPASGGAVGPGERARSG